MFSLGLFLRRFPLFRPIRRFFHSHSYKGLEKEVFGLKLSNPVGAAGTAIKDGGLIMGALSDFGYGFIEVDGNRETLEYLRRGESSVPVFASLKVACNNRSEEDTIASAERLFSTLYDFADAFVVCRDLTDPNPILTDEAFVTDLLDRLISTRLSEEEYKPLLVKVESSFDPSLLDVLTGYCRLSGIDGIVVEGDSLPEALETMENIVKKTSSRFPVVLSAPFRLASEASDALAKGASLLLLRPFRGSPIPRPKEILRVLEDEITGQEIEFE